MEQAPSAPELYLIAHKVRGEPAFDVACKLRIGDEEGWIIPTSGHRAYPYWITELKLLGYVFKADGSVPNLVAPMPKGLPDHYSAERDKTPSATLFDRLGFKRAAGPVITRRL